MARVETVIQSLPATGTLLMLRPHQILRTESNKAARPGPPPPDEQKAIEGLARELRTVGQIVPLVVTESAKAGVYLLTDGGRRLAAAQLIETESGGEFPLMCVTGSSEDAMQAAIHANIKRRGLTALQFAHLCANLRKEHGWTGTKELSEYLGVSRAQVSQHDKLLRRPDAMPVETYEKLLALVQAGRAGADAAFYTLTKVDPAKAEKVIERAQELAERDQTKSDVVTTPETGHAPQRSAKSQQTASVKVPVMSVHQSPMNPLRWCLNLRCGHELWVTSKKKPSRQSIRCTECPKSKTAKLPPLGKPETTGNRAPVASARVEKKHVREAAAESRAIVQPTQRTLPELRVLFDKLHGTAYPDPMRCFISELADRWWRGESSDKDVMQRWTQVAVLVEEAMERNRRSVTKRTKQ